MRSIADPWSWRIGEALFGPANRHTGAARSGWSGMSGERPELGDSRADSNAQWQKRRAPIDALSGLKERSSRLQVAGGTAPQAQLRLTGPPAGVRHLADLNKKLRRQERPSNANREKNLLRGGGHQDDIAEVNRSGPGIPVARLVRANGEAALHLEAEAADTGDRPQRRSERVAVARCRLQRPRRDYQIRSADRFVP